MRMANGYLNNWHLSKQLRIVMKILDKMVTCKIISLMPRLLGERKLYTFGWSGICGSVEDGCRGLFGFCFLVQMFHHRQNTGRRLVALLVFSLLW